MNLTETKEMQEFFSNYKFPRKRDVIIDCFKKFASLEVKSIDDFLKLNQTFPLFFLDNFKYFDIDQEQQLLILEHLDKFTYFLNEYLNDLGITSRKMYADILGEVLPNGKNTNILDVGAGELALSSLLIHEKTDKQVDAIDINEFYIEKNLMSKFNINLINIRFKPLTKVKKYDLITGYAPCKATLALVKNAKKHNKPYLLKYCLCGLPEDIKYSNPNEYWKNYLSEIDPNVKVFDGYIYNLDITNSQFEKLIDKFGSQQSLLKNEFNKEKSVNDLIFDMLFAKQPNL